MHIKLVLRFCEHPPPLPTHTGLHSAAVRAADSDGRQDRPGGPQRPGEHPASGTAGGEIARRTQRLRPLDRRMLRYCH